MTLEQFVALLFIIGLLIVAAWLVIEAGRWLWTLIAQPTRVRWQDRSVQPPQPTRRPAGRAQGRSPGQAGIELGPPRLTQVDMQSLFGGPALRRGVPLIIPQHHDPLWTEKGWQRNGNRYTGYYRAAGRQWRGLIQESYPGGFKAFIWNPPLRDLERRTSHRQCFRNGGRDRRYEIHFHHAPISLDHAIASIEAVLAEALGVRL